MRKPNVFPSRPLRMLSVATALLGSLPALGQVHVIGLAVSVSCPRSVESGASFTCEYTITNLDDQHGMENLTFSIDPFPGGPLNPTTCLQNGVPVTSLGAAGTGTESCSGTLAERAPVNCGTEPELIVTLFGASGTDADVGAFHGLPTSGSTIKQTVVEPRFCSPTHATGFTVTVSCPAVVLSGASFTCTYSITNVDDQHWTDNLAVSTVSPFPGGSANPVSCLQDGIPVTNLGAAATATESCGGSFSETAPIICSTPAGIVATQVQATGTDGDIGPFADLPVAGSAVTQTSVQPVPCGEPRTVSGHGWFVSPAGAYLADAQLTGKATFDFVVKPSRGSSALTGDVDFQFDGADFHFESTTLDSLVILEATARVRGTGTVNGAGNFGFELAVQDARIGDSGKVDRFRLRIWDLASGNQIVYDNEIREPEGADPTTAIDGGNIVIHKK